MIPTFRTDRVWRVCCVYEVIARAEHEDAISCTPVSGEPVVAGFTAKGQAAPDETLPSHADADVQVAVLASAGGEETGAIPVVPEVLEVSWAQVQPAESARPGEERLVSCDLPPRTPACGVHRERAQKKAVS